MAGVWNEDFQAQALIGKSVRLAAALEVKNRCLDDDEEDEPKEEDDVKKEAHGFQGGDFLGDPLGEEGVEGKLSQNAEED